MEISGVHAEHVKHWAGWSILKKVYYGSKFAVIAAAESSPCVMANTKRT